MRVKRMETHAVFHREVVNGTPSLVNQDSFLMSYKMQNRGRQHSRLGQSPVTGQLRCYSSGYLPRLVPIAPSFSLDPVHGRKAAELSACRLPMHALPAFAG